MQIAITKKLADKLKLSKLLPLVQSDGFYTWRANITQDGHHRLLVFMHDASRYVLVVEKPTAKDFNRLPELFKETLRASLLLEQINPEVIERYLAEAGEITLAANSGKEGTAQLSRACEDAWFGVEENAGNDYLSVRASHVPVFSNKSRNGSFPYEMFINLLARYNLPVKCATAYDLTIRLKLEKEDAVRQIRVPANITFLMLHKIIQKAYNWQNYHLYRFCFYKNDFDYYVKPDFEIDCGVDVETNKKPIMTNETRLFEYLPKWKSCMYNYDFGDNWYHLIELTKVHENYEGDIPLLLSGSGDAPPEDVGGLDGFLEFKKIISNPNDEQYDEMSGWGKSQGWAPFDFDKVAFDVKLALGW